MRVTFKWAALLALFTGCRARPLPPPTVADLRFPVVVIYGKSSVVLFKDAADLGTMGISHLNNVTGPPPLIDSSFAVYRLAGLASTHGGLWLMAHPTGSTPVKFELQRAPASSIEVARGLLRQRLAEQAWRTDLEVKRRQLDAEQTLEGMLGIVQGRGE